MGTDYPFRDLDHLFFLNLEEMVRSEYPRTRLRDSKGLEVKVVPPYPSPRSSIPVTS